MPLVATAGGYYTKVPYTNQSRPLFITAAGITYAFLANKRNGALLVAKHLRFQKVLNLHCRDTSGLPTQPLAADFGAPLAYYSEPTLLGFMAMLRPESQSECGPRKTGV